jgi:predicted nicotinamide N-methyase
MTTLTLLQRFYDASESPHDLALLRMEYLDTTNEDVDGGRKGQGLAKEFVQIWVDVQQQQQQQGNSNSRDTGVLIEMLTILRNVAIADITLAEEIMRCGETYQLLQDIVVLLHDGKLTSIPTSSSISSSSSSWDVNSNNTVQLIRALIEEIQSSLMSSYPRYSTINIIDHSIHDHVSDNYQHDGTDVSEGGLLLPPYSHDELKRRLPLTYGLPQQQQQQQQDENDTIFLGEGRQHNGRDREDLQMMVHQVTDEAETDTHDVGFVMWPSAIMLSRWIAMNPSVILDCCCGNVGTEESSSSSSSTSNEYNTNNSTILELGAGCGLVGITAAAIINQHYHEQKLLLHKGKDNETAQDSKKGEEEYDHEGGRHDPQGLSNRANVILTDYLPTILDNLKRNLLLNGLNDEYPTASVSGLDFFDQPGNSDYNGDDDNNDVLVSGGWIDMEGTRRPHVKLILGADIIVYSNDATMVANTIHSALMEGGRAIIMSRDRRFGVEEFPTACERVGLNVTVTDLGMGSDQHNDAQLVLDLEHTPSYNGGYDLIIFTIDKPICQ